MKAKIFAAFAACFFSHAIMAEDYSSLIPANAVEIPLANGDFESTEPAATKAYLSGKTWDKIAGFENITLSNDAHGGKQALQYLTDSSSYVIVRKGTPVEASWKGKSLLLLFYAKGHSRIGCEIQARWQEDKKCQSLKTSMPRARLGLDEEVWLPYAIYTEPLPAEAENIYIIFNTDMKYQKWLIDDVKLYTLESPANIESETGAFKGELSTLGREYCEGRGEIEPDFANIAPYAKINTSPLLHMLYRMTDGIMGTGVTLKGEGACRLDFRYGKPQTVTSLRLSLPPQYFAIFADTKGNGEYDKFIAQGLNKPLLGYWGRKEWPWYRVDLPQPMQVYGIRFVEFSAKPGTIMEFQILSPASSAKGLITESQVTPNAEVPVLTEGAAMPLPIPSQAQKYLQGFTIEPWMYGSQDGYNTEKPRKPLAEWPGFKKMMEDYQYFGANLINLFPPKTWVEVKDRKGGGPFPFDVMWPSQVYKWSSKEKYLQELCNEVHKEGIQVWTCNRVWNFRDDIPYPPKDKAGTWGRYGQCAIQAVAEQAENGADTVSLCQDEEFWNVTYPKSYFAISPIPADADDNKKIQIAAQNDVAEARQKAFAKRWNIPASQLPDKVEDKELYRQYVIFYLEEVGKLMKAESDAAKKANPKVKTFLELSQTDPFCNRFSHSEAISDHDLFGFGANIDFFNCDPYFTREDWIGCYNPSFAAQVLRASTPARQAELTLNYSWGSGNHKKNPLCIETYPKISYPGAALGAVLNGAQGVHFWRYNFACDMDPIHEGREGVKLAFSMLDTLAAWGGRDSHIPQDIAVLRSRASEDWFQLKVIAGNYSGAQADKSMGFDLFHWLLLQLFQKGYSFETYYQDHPEAWADAARFKLVILPFPYSMGKKEFDTLNAIIERGSKVIAMGAKGETDELGNPYPKPLLEELIASGKISYLEINPRKTGSHPETIKTFCELLNSSLAERRSLALNSYGKDVQAGCLERNDKDKLIVLINWSDRDTVVDLGLKMPGKTSSMIFFSSAIKYRAMQRDLEKVNAMTLNGKESLSADDLKSFRVSLKSGEAKILHIFAE
ncbi:MAG: hypothetical protein A2X49_14610 [Lentisphaerae bacterium GWF2_52_8]|nr:MAG: hypothetical protein A2X49_14610 [Lentisphaerae bacterium GWF2_52_8]